MPEPKDYLFDLKHRLVGAAVLIGAVIIIAPIVLTGPEQSHRHALIGNGDVVAPIQQTFISRVMVDNPDVAAQQSAAESLKDQVDPKKQSGAEDPAKGVKSQGINDDKPMNDSVELVSGWVVRVGVFQIPENAKKRQSLLGENGFEVKLEKAELDGKAAIRVFLGPFPSEDKAERIKAQAVMVTNDKAFVARYP